MGQFSDLYKAFRDFVTDGVPSSGKNEPNKAEIRAIGTALDDKFEDIEERIDGVSSGIVRHEDVRAATTADDVLATAYENGDTLDGVVLATNDRILIKNEATPTANGVWVVQASGAPVRATDMDVDAEFPGATVFVREGTVNAGSTWTCSNTAVTVGVTNILFVLTGETDSLDFTVPTTLDSIRGVGANIASDTTTDLSTATGDIVGVTGTTQIESLGTDTAGIERQVRFTDALTIKHNDTSMILPFGQDMTVEANDVVTFRSLGSGNWIAVEGRAGPVQHVAGAVSATGITIDHRGFAVPGIHVDETGTEYHHNYDRLPSGAIYPGLTTDRRGFVVPPLADDTTDDVIAEDNLFNTAQYEYAQAIVDAERLRLANISLSPLKRVSTGWRFKPRTGQSFEARDNVARLFLNNLRVGTGEFVYHGAMIGPDVGNVGTGTTFDTFQGTVVRSNVALATATGQTAVTHSGEQTIDGTLTSGSRVADLYNSNAALRGVFVTAAGAWTRATDMDTGAEMFNSSFTVTGGATNAGKKFKCVTPETITLGSTNLTFEEMDAENRDFWFLREAWTAGTNSDYVYSPAEIVAGDFASNSRAGGPAPLCSWARQWLRRDWLQQDQDTADTTILDVVVSSAKGEGTTDEVYGSPGKDRAIDMIRVFKEAITNNTIAAIDPFGDLLALPSGGDDKGVEIFHNLHGQSPNTDPAQITPPNDSYLEQITAFITDFSAQLADGTDGISQSEPFAFTMMQPGAIGWSNTVNECANQMVDIMDDVTGDGKYVFLVGAMWDMPSKRTLPTKATFTGSATTGTLTVTAFTDGDPLAVDDWISTATGIPVGKITALGTGTGGTGTYTVSLTTNFTSQEMKSAYDPDSGNGHPLLAGNIYMGCRQGIAEHYICDRQENFWVPKPMNGFYQDNKFLIPIASKFPGLHISPVCIGVEPTILPHLGLSLETSGGALATITSIRVVPGYDLIEGTIAEEDFSPYEIGKTGRYDGDTYFGVVCLRDGMTSNLPIKVPFVNDQRRAIGGYTDAPRNNGLGRHAEDIPGVVGEIDWGNPVMIRTFSMAELSIA